MHIVNLLNQFIKRRGNISFVYFDLQSHLCICLKQKYRWETYFYDIKNIYSFIFFVIVKLKIQWKYHPMEERLTNMHRHGQHVVPYIEKAARRVSSVVDAW